MKGQAEGLPQVAPGPPTTHSAAGHLYTQPRQHAAIRLATPQSHKMDPRK